MLFRRSTVLFDIIYTQLSNTRNWDTMNELLLLDTAKFTLAPYSLATQLTRSKTGFLQICSVQEDVIVFLEFNKKPKGLFRFSWDFDSVWHCARESTR